MEIPNDVAPVYWIKFTKEISNPNIKTRNFYTKLGRAYSNDFVPLHSRASRRPYTLEDVTIGNQTGALFVRHPKVMVKQLWLGYISSPDFAKGYLQFRDLPEQPSVSTLPLKILNAANGSQYQRTLQQIEQVTQELYNAKVNNSPFWQMYQDYILRTAEAFSKVILGKVTPVAFTLRNSLAHEYRKPFNLSTVPLSRSAY